MKHDGVGEQHGRRNDRHTLDLLYNFRAQLDGKLVGIQLFTQNQMRVASGKSRTDDVDLLQRKALILKTGDPEKSELGVQNQRHAVPGFYMCEYERGKNQHGDNVRQHEFCRTVCLDQLKLRAVVPEMKRVFTLNHFLKKRETFFDVHAGIPFFSGSSFRGNAGFPSDVLSVCCGRPQSVQKSSSSLSAIQNYQGDSSENNFLPGDHRGCRQRRR